MKRFTLLVSALAFLASSTLLAGEKEKTVLKVKGMHCPSCVSMIKKTVKKIEGVEDATIDLKAGEVTLLFEPEKKPIQGVVKAINKMGYKVVSDDSTTNARNSCCDSETRD